MVNAIALSWSERRGLQLAIANETSIESHLLTPSSKATELKIAETKSIKIKHRITAMSYSPDGRFLAYGSMNGGAEFLSLRERDTLQVPLYGHKNFITAIKFSPDGKFIATSSLDNTVKLWNTKTYTEIAEFSHAAWVWDIDFSDDSSLLLSVGEDGDVHIWITQVEEIVNQLCGKVTDKLSQEQLKEYTSVGVKYRTPNCLTDEQLLQKKK